MAEATVLVVSSRESLRSVVLQAAFFLAVNNCNKAQTQGIWGRGRRMQDSGCLHLGFRLEGIEMFYTFKPEPPMQTLAQVARQHGHLQTDPCKEKALVIILVVTPTP